MSELQWILSRDACFRYMLLSRMMSDCNYYLGFGCKSPKRLWAGEEKEQIAYMKAIWNSFPEDAKPEWLSFQEILDYEKQMTVDQRLPEEK